MDDTTPHSSAWNLQVWLSFLVSLSFTVIGIAVLPAGLWVRGYLVMGLFFTVGSTITLAKTQRDNHEAARLRNRLSQAKNEKILREFEREAA